MNIRHFLRTLAKQPGFTTVVILSLAIGIGATTVMYAVAHRVLLERMQVVDPDSLVLLKWKSPEFPAESLSGNVSFGEGGPESTSFSHPALLYFREHSKTLPQIVAFSSLDRLNVSTGAEAAGARGQFVSGNYYSDLGVRAALGRLIQPSDDAAGAAPVAVLSNVYWRDAYGGAGDVLGKTIRLNGKPFVIVGVEPAGFTGTLDVGAPAQVVIAASMQPVVSTKAELTDPTAWWMQFIGRRAPGVSDAAVAAEMSGLLQQYVRAHTPSLAGIERIRVTPLPGGQGLLDQRQTFRRPVLILLGAVVLVLLIACANVAGLLLARSMARRKELMVRMSVGASRATIIRQLLFESIALSLLGGLAGLALATWARRLAPLVLPQYGSDVQLNLPLDFRLFAAAFLVSVISGIVFGVLPALRATRLDLSPALRERGSTRTRAGSALIVAQVAIAVILVAGAGLFLRTVVNLASMETGFRSEGVLTFRLDPKLNGYEGERLRAFFESVQGNLQRIPGVQSVSLTSHGLLTGGSAMATLKTDLPDSKGDEHVRMNYVTPEFLPTMGIPLIAGRNLTATDRNVAVISEALAKQFFPNINPIGHRIGFEKELDYEVIGVMKNARYADVREDMPATLFLPFWPELNTFRRMTIFIRTAGDPRDLAGPARAAVRQVDPNVPLFDLRTQEQQNARALRQERTLAATTLFFGGVALALAAIGLFGLMSYLVSGRTRETGIRLALGARAADVLRSTLGQSAALLAAGSIIGLAAAIFLTRYVSGMVFGIQPADPVAISGAVLTMMAVGLAAAFFPARRASKVDPARALRIE